MVFWEVTFGRYVVLHFVYAYKISRRHILKGDHSRLHIVLKHSDLPLLFYCLSPMKNIMNNSCVLWAHGKISLIWALMSLEPTAEVYEYGDTQNKTLFQCPSIFWARMFFVIWKVAWIKIYMYAQPLGRLKPPDNKMPSASQR